MWNWLIEVFRKWFSRKTETTVPAPAPQPSPAPAEDILATCKIHTAPESVRGWPVVSQLTVRWQGGHVYCDIPDWDIWPSPDGTIGNIWCFLFRDGEWHGGPCDGFRPPSRNFRSASALCVPQGDKRLYEPIAGETVKIMLSGPCRNGRGMSPAQRTSIADLVWK